MRLRLTRRALPLLMIVLSLAAGFVLLPAALQSATARTFAGEEGMTRTEVFTVEGPWHAVWRTEAPRFEPSTPVAIGLQ